MDLKKARENQLQSQSQIQIEQDNQKQLKNQQQGINLRPGTVLPGTIRIPQQPIQLQNKPSIAEMERMIKHIQSLNSATNQNNNKRMPELIDTSGDEDSTCDIPTYVSKKNRVNQNGLVDIITPNSPSNEVHDLYNGDIPVYVSKN
jgi:hypothetical protein